MSVRTRRLRSWTARVKVTSKVRSERGTREWGKAVAERPWLAVKLQVTVVAFFHEPSPHYCPPVKKIEVAAGRQLGYLRDCTIKVVKMDAYKQMMMPVAEKPTFTIHDKDYVTLRIHGISYSFQWNWDNDEGEDGEWFNTYISMPQAPDSLVWIEFYPWFHYRQGVDVDTAHTLYIYNGNDGTDAHVHDCMVVDHADIIGQKYKSLLKDMRMDDD